MSNTETNPTADNSQLVWGLAKIATGGGIIGAIWYFSPLPLMDIVMFWLVAIMPILGILMGLNIISSGTIELIWNGKLKERVNQKMAEMRATEEVLVKALTENEKTIALKAAEIRDREAAEVRAAQAQAQPATHAETPRKTRTPRARTVEAVQVEKVAEGTMVRKARRPKDQPTVEEAPTVVQ